MKAATLLSLVLACSVLSGCDLLKKKGDGAEAGADAAADAMVAVPEDAAPVAAADDAAAAPVPVEAKNKSDVARFPGETLVSDDDMKLGQPTPARTAPKTGAVVATLAPKSDVHKIAEYQNSVLVTFADPKDASATLMGWIAKESFNVVVPTVIKDAGATDAAKPVVLDAGPAKLTCPANQVAVILAKDPVCKKKCTKDTDCTKPGCAPVQQQGGGVVKACAAD